MNNTRLQDFVTSAAARGRVTFGDVRRLQRDYLAGGITSCDEAEMLIRLDGVVSRADRAWADWLVTAILDFAARCDQAIESGAGEPREQLKAVLAAAHASKAGRKIGREINRPVDRPAEPVQPAPQTIPFPVKTDNAPPARRPDVSLRLVTPVGICSSSNRLEMAA